MAFDVYFYVISAIGILVEGLLVWRLLNDRLLNRYPYFSAFILCDLVCNLALISVASLRQEWFRFSSGTALAVSALTGLLIIWEVARVLFPPDSTLRRLAQSTLLALAAFGLPAILALAWSQANSIHFSYRYVPPVFEQYLTLAQAILLLAIAAIARYYALPLGRNLRSLVFGFGLYLLLNAINFASLQIIHGFLPYWQLLSPALYIGLLAFWLWSFWEYAPAPSRTTAVRDSLESREQWKQAWLATTNLMKGNHN